MVLAIAALLFQISPAGQALPVVTANAEKVVSATAEANPPRASETQDDNTTVSGPVAPLSTAHLNLASVRLSAATKEAPAGSLNADSLDKPQNSQSLSTVRIPELPPAKPIQIVPAETAPPRRSWLMLSLAQHGAAAFDAYSTRDAIAKGAVELDPLMRPFAHSSGLYAAIQVGPVLLDMLSRQMQRSPSSFVRRIWWLPQSVSTAGYIFSGTHNLNLANPTVK